MLEADDALLCGKQLGRRLSISCRTIENWRSLGKGPKYIRIGGRVKYQMSDVLDWLKREQTSR